MPKIPTHLKTTITIPQETKVKPEEIDISGWSRQTQNGLSQTDSKYKTSGMVLGPFFCYKVDGGGHYRLVMYKTDPIIQVTSLTNEEDCLKTGSYLWTNFFRALIGTTRQEVQAKLPKWLRDWGVDCYKQDKFLDPSTYEE